MLVFIEHLTGRRALAGAGCLPKNVVRRGLCPVRDRKPRDYGAFCSAMQTVATEGKSGRFVDFQGFGNIHRFNAKALTGRRIPRESAARPRGAAATFAPAGAFR